MGESHHTRNMEWNTGEVWPVPVELSLLNNLNGMNTHSITDTHHLMFGNGAHMSFPHFRPRFQPPVHLSSSHIGSLPLNVNVSIPISQHSLVDSGQEDPDVSHDNCQDSHSIPQSIPLNNNSDVLDETDDASDDDEEDDEEEEEEEEVNEVTMSHDVQPQQQQHGSLIGMTHAMEQNENLVQSCAQVQNSCAQQQQQQQPTMLSMDNSVQVQQQQQSCLQQKQTNMDIVQHSQHRLNSHPTHHSIQIPHSQQQQQPPPQPINPLRMFMTDDFTVQNENYDPNSGLSVHGKMYYEGRVVLHLKQWADSPENHSAGPNGNIFSSCAEQQKGYLQGCAVCRWKSPASQENHRSQKDHRHNVKGVLFTFGDCILVELYPDAPPLINSNGQTSKPPAATTQVPPPESLPKEHPTLPSYMTTVPIQEEQSKKFMVHHEMEQQHMGCLGNQSQQQQQQQQVPMPQNPTEKHHVIHHTHNNHHHHSESAPEDQWWTDFTTSEDLKQQQQQREAVDAEGVDNQDGNSNPNTDSSCIGNLELDSQDRENHEHDNSSSKCPINNTNNDCSNLLSNNSQLESHRNDHHHHSTMISLEVDLSPSEAPDNVHLDTTHTTAISNSSNSSSISCSSSNIDSNSNNSSSNTECKENDTSHTNIFHAEESQNSCISSSGSNNDLSINDKFTSSDVKPIKNKNSIAATGVIIKPTGKTSAGCKLRHSCPACEKRFNLKRSLKQHLEEVHFKNNALCCIHCLEQFTEETRLKTHTCQPKELVQNQQKKKTLSFGKIFTKALPLVSELAVNTNNGSNNIKNGHSTNDDNGNSKTSQSELNEMEENHGDTNNCNDVEPSQDFETNTKPVNKPSKVGRIRPSNKSKAGKSKKQDISRNSPSEIEEQESHHDDDYQIDLSESSSSRDDDEVDGTTTNNSHDGTLSNEIIINSNKKLKGNKNDKPFKCEVCKKRFTVERRLQNHALSHSAERCAQCDKCGKRFQRKDKLMRHMYVHATEKLFSCEICQKRFSRRDKLSDHLKSHGGADEIHNCPKCEKQFLRPDILKQHLKLHTMGNKYQCTECLRFVTGKSRLEKHMDRHKEAKASGQTLLCPLCTKYFIQKQSLKAHVKKFHPNSNINLDTPESDFQQQQVPTLKVEAEFQKQKNDQVDSQQQQQQHQSPPNSGSLVLNKPKEFECNQCHKQFARKQALKKHLLVRKHHQTEHQLFNSKSSLISNHDGPTNANNNEDFSNHDEDNTFTASLINNPMNNNNNNTSPGRKENSSVPVNNLSPTDAQVHIISSALQVSSPVHTINTSTLSVIPNIIQQSINPSCSNANATHLQHGTLSHPNHHQHIISAHANNQGGGTQITSMSHPSGQIHTNIGQHLTVPTMQHHVSMTAATQSINQAICGSSYVLTYPHYSYQ